MSIAKSIPGVIVGVAAALALPAAADAAQTNTTPLSVTATVVADCTVAVGTGLTFSGYDPIANTGATSSTTITVKCTSGTTGTVTLDQGSHADTAGGSSDSVPKRRMSNVGSTEFLPYGLFQDSSHATIWGNTALTGEQFTGSDTSTTGSLTVYGLISGGSNPPAGSYSDSVTVTVTF